MRGVWWLRQERVSWTFSRPHNIWQQWHCHSPHRSTAYHLGSRKCFPHQAWCHQHPLQSQFGHRWAETRPYTWGRHSFRQEPIAWWCHCTSCGPTAYTVGRGRSCYRHHCSRQHRGTSCQISWGYHGHHRRPGTWHGAFYLTPPPPPTHPTPPIPEVQLFKNLTLKIQGQARKWGHIIGPISYQSTSLSFHVNWSSHSWDIWKFDLDNPRSRSHTGSNILSSYIPFGLCQSAFHFLR